MRTEKGAVVLLHKGRQTEAIVGETRHFSGDREVTAEEQAREIQAARRRQFAYERDYAAKHPKEYAQRRAQLKSRENSRGVVTTTMQAS